MLSNLRALCSFQAQVKIGCNSLPKFSKASKHNCPIADSWATSSLARELSEVFRSQHSYMFTH